MLGKGNEKKIKNKNALVLGLAAGLIVILLLSELFQSGIALLAGTVNFNLVFSITGFSSSFDFPAESNTIISLVVYLSPLLLILVLLEIGMRILKNSPLGLTRYSTIVFEMILIGYLIVNVFYGAIAVVLQLPDNDWVNLILHLELPLEGGIIFMFFIILLLAVYLNYTTKRIINYINA